MQFWYIAPTGHQACENKRATVVRVLHFCLFWLLCNNLPTGCKEPHLVSLYKSLTILRKPLKEREEVGRNDVHLRQHGEQPLRGHKECLSLLNQRVLVSTHAGIFTGKNLESGLITLRQNALRKASRENGLRFLKRWSKRQ